MMKNSENLQTDSVSIYRILEVNKNSKLPERGVVIWVSLLF